jgi:hypothetical protein
MNAKIIHVVFELGRKDVCPIQLIQPSRQLKAIHVFLGHLQEIYSMLKTLYFGNITHPK